MSEHRSNLFNKIVKLYFEMNNNVDKVMCLRRKIAGGGILKYIRRARYHRLCAQLGCFLPVSTKIGDNCCFPHGLSGVMISSGAVIGNGCTIFHQVTIGSNTLEDSKSFGTPTIGDNVYIGAGAKIIGNVKVGNNARIGANCVITEDVPENATVVMNKPRVILHSMPKDNTFKAYKKKQMD